jgi:6-phosphogluconate dehydrogenase
MNAREREANMLKRCVLAARGKGVMAKDQQEANVFRVAAMVVRSRLPQEAAGLMQASEDYFSSHPMDRLPEVDVVKNGWVSSLPRLRDMLSLEFRQRT